MSNPRESVFVPCGHRCCCIDCAINVYEKFGKCSLCSTKIDCLLKKVFDI